MDNILNEGYKPHIMKIIPLKIPALSGKEINNNRLILKEIALKGPMSKYDFTKMKRKGYSTIFRRVEDLYEKGYLGITEKKEQTKNPEAFKTLYGLTWKGLIASLFEEEVQSNFIEVLLNNPLLELPIKEEVLNTLINHKIWTKEELKEYIRGFFIGLVKALPYNIEFLDNWAIIVVCPAATKQMEIDFSKIDTKKIRNIIPILQDPRIFPHVMKLVNNWKSDLKQSLKEIETIEHLLNSENLLEK